MKKYVVDLMNPKSIKECIKGLREYKRTFRDKVDMFGQALAERCSEEVRIHILGYGAIDTGRLYNSIEILKGKSYGSQVKYYVVANDENACWVEFGTGSRGEASPYPYPLPKGVRWNYNVGKTIFTTKDGRRGWVFPANDGNWYFTEGQPARPFMGQSAVALYDEVEWIAHEVFDR